MAVPLVNMQARDFLNALAGQHQDSNSASVWRVNGNVRAFEPGIESNKFVIVKPASAWGLRLGRYAGRRVCVQLKTSRRCAPIVEFRFYGPRVRRAYIAANVVGHGPFAALENGTQDPDHIVCGDISCNTILAKNVADFFEASLNVSRRGLVLGFEMLNVSCEKIGHGAQPAIAGAFDAGSFANDIGEVALEDFAHFSKAHSRIRTDLRSGAPTVTPLLRHPIGRNAGRHRLDDEGEPAGAAAFAIGQGDMLGELSCSLDRLANCAVGEARHARVLGSIGGCYWGRYRSRSVLRQSKPSLSEIKERPVFTRDFA